MAAGRQNKRLSSSNLHEHYKGRKKKRLDSSDYILNLRSHVHLQWDNGLQRVVAKREQIGITWKEMSPYIECLPKSHFGLADVFSFPKEVLDLDNLLEVLSYEVWLTCLSESERKLLMQFLPSCASSERTVRLLLAGENLHFGNPFLKWSTVLCSCDLHPDAILHKEQEIGVKKKQYFMEIYKYHTDMLAVLRSLKEKAETCDDPEKFWRKFSTLNYIGKRVDEEKNNCFPSKKKELALKICNRNVDATKYITYIKVNKRQLQMVKEVKHSSDGIHSKSLNRVLGDINNYHLYSYESYIDEENNAFGENWIQITKDVHAAFEEHNKRKFLRVEQMKCLKKELAGSRALAHCKAEEAVPGNSSDEIDHSIEMIDENDYEASLNPTHDHIMECIPSLNSHRQLTTSISNQESHSLKSTNEVRTSKSIKILDSCRISNELKPLVSPLKSTWAVHRQPRKVLQPTPITYFERDIEKQDARQPICSAFNVDPTSRLLNSYSRSHDAGNSAFLMAPDMPSSHTYVRTNDSSQPEHQFMMDEESLPKSNQFSLINEKHACDKPVYNQNKTRFDDHIGYYPPSLADGLGQLDSLSGSGGRSVGTGGNLFGVFQEFKDLQCRSLLDTSDAAQVQDCGGMNLTDSHAHSQMSSSTGHDSGVNPLLDVLWMNYPHPNPCFKDNVRKLFMRQWNQ